MHHNTQCSRVCCVGVQSESSIIACMAHGTRSIHANQHRRRHLAVVQFTQKSAPRQRRRCSNDGIYICKRITIIIHTCLKRHPHDERRTLNDDNDKCTNMRTAHDAIICTCTIDTVSNTSLSGRH